MDNIDIILNKINRLLFTKYMNVCSMQYNLYFSVQFRQVAVCKAGTEAVVTVRVIWCNLVCSKEQWNWSCVVGHLRVMSRV